MWLGIPKTQKQNKTKKTVTRFSFTEEESIEEIFRCIWDSYNNIIP